MSEGDPYVYPGTSILKNKPDLKSQDELDRFERVSAGMRQIHMPTDIPMTADGYRAIHRQLFQDVYEWAGTYRTVNLTKMTDTPVEFKLGPYVGAEMRRVFGELGADNYLRGLDTDTYAYRAAVYMQDLNTIHPFREGNGRTQRVFLGELTRQAGHKLDMTTISRDGWINASIAGYNNDHGPMTDCIRDAMAGRGQEQARGEVEVNRQWLAPETKSRGRTR